MPESVLVTLKNTCKAPRALHNVHRQVVVVPPNGEKENVEISRTLLKILQRGDSDLVATPQAKVTAPKLPPKPKSDEGGSQATGSKQTHTPTKTADDIPEELHDLSSKELDKALKEWDWNELRRLAIDVSGHRIRNRDEANAAIKKALGK